MWPFRLQRDRGTDTVAEIVNLRQARKRATRMHEDKRAQESRAHHGRSISDRKLEDTVRKNRDRSLDQHRIEKDPE
jgi:hypothetical protein